MILRLPLSCSPLFTSGCRVRDVHLKATCHCTVQERQVRHSKPVSTQSFEFFAKLTPMKNVDGRSLFPQSHGLSFNPRAIENLAPILARILSHLHSGDAGLFLLELNMS
ncbi:hypothetical protein BJX62DRAFT_201507 [Aspergillus germanicus]